MTQAAEDPVRESTRRAALTGRRESFKHGLGTGPPPLCQERAVETHLFCERLFSG